MADESLATPPPPKERRSWHVTILIAKIVEVILAIVIVGLMVDPLNSYQKIFNRPRTKLDDVAFVYVAVAGYLLINVLFLIGYVLGDRIPKRTLIMFSTVGCAMHIAAASVMVHTWRKAMGSYLDFHNNAIHSSKQYNDMILSGAFFTFVNAAVLGADVFLTIKYS
ncbi:uncharacterized protein [Chelonus insularis]|uniref:uncharacterized protein n=1 Tax=Chelonus insularis TaxID=460826 RepID=UPI00158E21C6|nr:uncharacterized protein LOC118064191 [Chelonus insularis]